MTADRTLHIVVNGQPQTVEAATLSTLLDELGYGGATVATALNQSFVRAVDRAATTLSAGDAVEIVTPRQGG